MDVSAVRTEIKAWERQFRQDHGRDPTIQEIKDIPEIAEKYKLYKKLSKQPQSSQSGRRVSPTRDGSTKPAASSSALLSTSKSKPRPVKTQPPASTSNPFSPTKPKTAKHGSIFDTSEELPIPSLFASASRINPFKTPTKPKKPRERPRSTVPPISELEEDPFPLISESVQVNATQDSAYDEEPHATFTDTTEHLPPAIAAANVATPIKDKSAVSRARKRLRGEFVSPSPVKEKRQRVAERVSALSFEVEASDEEEQNVGRRHGGEAFIDDTPARPPIGKKQFKVLFDETAGQSSATVRTTTHRQSSASMTGMTRTKSMTAKGLFGFGFSSSRENVTGLSRTKSRALSPTSEHSDEDMDWDASKASSSSSSKLRAPDFSPSVASKPATSTKLVRNGMKIPGAVLPTRDDLQSLPSNASTSTSSKKRPLSPPRNSQNPSSPSTPKPSLTSLPLLPPSPPTADTQASHQRYAEKGKGKALALARKKSKLLAATGNDDDASDDDEDAEELDGRLKVKEVSRWGRHRSRDVLEDLPPSEDLQADSEPEFDLSLYRPSVPPRASSAYPDEDDTEGEKFEVNLPADLRRVLALEPPPHVAPPSEVEAEKLVKGLLYGRREGHYDPQRGGEVWGVGEVGEEDEEEDEFALLERKRKEKEESEEEWEGEPVPWEVGEL